MTTHQADANGHARTRSGVERGPGQPQAVTAAFIGCEASINNSPTTPMDDNPHNRPNREKATNSAPTMTEAVPRPLYLRLRRSATSMAATSIATTTMDIMMRTQDLSRSKSVMAGGF